jgi:GNAT superfamily N-acetyltransferase
MPPQSEYSIRAMEHGDLDAVLLLFSSVAEERVWIGTEPGFDRPKYKDIFGLSIALGNGMFVAVHEGDIIGMISSYRHEEYGWTLGMLLDKHHRGRGIGYQLLEQLFSWARGRSIGQLSLLVFPHNERALALYQRTGFEEIERYEADVTRENGEVWDTILMRKLL